MVKFIRSDLDFILQQILLAEANAATIAGPGTPMLELLPNAEVPWGLRTVTGVNNNLVPGQSQFGAADTVFPRLTTPEWVTQTNPGVLNPGVNPPPFPVGFDYSLPGNIIDATPRIASNLIVDQTANNPAAVVAALTNGNLGLSPTPGNLVTSPGLDGLFGPNPVTGINDDTQVYFIQNTTPDFGLTAPFNSWMTFFGQFFDHGLDLLQKSKTEIVYIPLQRDDPLYNTTPNHFMALSRAVGATGVTGAGALESAQNTTSPFVDQNQTYTSHPSHQVFLREYAMVGGKPVATGKLLTDHVIVVDPITGVSHLGADKGGMATWATVKAQAHDMLGIQLTDKFVGSVPLLRTDDYGHFIRGANGFPLVVTGIGPDGIPNTADDTVTEGNPLANGGRGISLDSVIAPAVLTSHQFLVDIAHAADPSGGKIADTDGVIGILNPNEFPNPNFNPAAPPGSPNSNPFLPQYDNELLNKHFIAGDGRVNENIGLTAVHDIFHSEHNRLVQQTKDVALADAASLLATQLASGATLAVAQAASVAFLNKWLITAVTHVPLAAEVATLDWNGERLFQAAKFGTEMQYQHLVFEEFARTIQPNIDGFLAPFGYDVTIDPSIVAEFAHTVYRFGHSMLTETVDRLDPLFNPITADPLHPTNDQQLGLIAAFLNPLAYAASGVTNEQATGAIVRGVTRQAGNEIDEFITDALRNNLVGLPLDLATLNLARGRDTGIPSLNDARKQFFSATNDGQLKPYESWVDLMNQLKHPESLINFIAAYGTHTSITGATTLAGKRAAATDIVLGTGAAPADRLDFLNSTGAYASTPLTLPGVDKVVGTADDIHTFRTTTGLDSVDFWIGGLAERQMVNGGLLGATFNFVFETQLENLQNGDRLYYLSRTAGMNFGTELEQNSFAQLIMLNTDATHLSANVFLTPKYTLEGDITKQYNAHTGVFDPITGVELTRVDPLGGVVIHDGTGTHAVAPLVMRDNPHTPVNEALSTTGRYLHYTGNDTVVIGGTAFDDDLQAGTSDDDTVYGDAGNDRIEGGFGDDNLFGGTGDDLITDMGGNDVLRGEAGNDVLFDGHSLIAAPATNILFGGDGKDFIVTREDISTIFGGKGDDFILGNKVNLPETGNEGDDWIETGTQDGSPGDNFNPLLGDDIPGNDIFIGGGGFDEFIGEGGDDIFTGSDAQDKMDGMSGFDWVTYKFDKQGVTVDLTLAALNAPPVAPSPASILDRFAETDGLSGSKFADILLGEETDAGGRAGITARSQALTGHGIDIIAGMQAELDTLFAAELAGLAPLQTGVLATGVGGPPAARHITSFDSGNFMIGGAGSDLITARGGDDLIDGDKWLNVRISVRANSNTDPVTGLPTGAEINSFDLMSGKSTSTTANDTSGKTLVQYMLERTYNPAQLFAVRELKDDAFVPGNPAATLANRNLGTNFDTSNYRGAASEYTIAVNGVAVTVVGDHIVNAAGATISIGAEDIVTVTDNNATPRDGTDHLIHVERLQFGDVAVTLRQSLNAGPVGAPTITDTTPGATLATLKTGDMLHASIAGVTDANNITANNPTGAVDLTSNIRYTWQSERAPGTNVFEDIVLLPAGDLAFESASGVNFRLTSVVDGLRLRLKAIYEDGHGVTEQVFSGPTAAVTAVAVPPPAPPVVHPDATAGGVGIQLVRSDLDFILKQIRIAEEHVKGTPLTDLIPNIRLAYGLRTVDGTENNLLQDANRAINQNKFGAADTVFPRLLPPKFDTAEAGTSYAQTAVNPAANPQTNPVAAGVVIDSQPRVISNLIVDQTATNHAAYAAAVDPGLNGVLDYNFGQTGVVTDDVLKDGATLVSSPGLDGVFGTGDDKQVFKIDNVKPDFGLTAPYNSWFTFFGQFFDHGLDLVTKGGSGTVFVPLKADDPLFVPGSPTNFMVLTRATNQPGADGILGTADDIHEQSNTTTPFVDQNQTYTSHPSHQVFLREYMMDASGHPVATGKLITNHALNADGSLTIDGTGHLANDTGGMATWAVVKAQAKQMLGINLTDANVFNAPLLATDQYGNFIKGAHGMPQVVMKGVDGIAGTADDVLVEGDRTAPISLANAVGTGHQFLIDIAHAADPNGALPGQPALTRFTDGSATNGATPAGTYDGDLLDKHYIAGDGRVNENIGLTTVHSIFHHEHNRLVDQAKATALAQNDLAFLNEYLDPLHQLLAPPANADEIAALQWNGERLFQTAKFGTEMQYQHLVFEEFARTIQPTVDAFFAPTQVYDVDLDPSIVAEFAHTVYRFGHSMLTETVDRFNANFDVIDQNNNVVTGGQGQQMGLIKAFLNPLAFEASGVNSITGTFSVEDAAAAIIRGTTRDVGNELDEFVTEALRNNLVGLPLDLATLNLARGRDVGIPSLNAARKDFFNQTGDTWVKPYDSWSDLVLSLKHPESLINFIAAYGTHPLITGALTLADKRAAASDIVLGNGATVIADRFEFLNSTGAWANNTLDTHTRDRDGVTTTGLGSIDLWIGGLAEKQTVFGGLLGSTFNFVFENQLEKLQDGDRFYYLERTDGLSLRAELESNSFAKLIMANTTATHLPGLVFMSPAYTLEADPTKQHTGLGLGGRADPIGGLAVNTVTTVGTVTTLTPHEITPLVLRVDLHPDTDPTHRQYTHYVEYTAHGINAETIVIGGTEGNDKLIAGDSDDDTIWGDGGDDYIDGGYGNDQLRGGAGDDIIVDKGGDDNIQGGDGNDAIQGGNGANLILGGFGQDFIITGEDNSEAFGGQGNDFILGSKSNEQDIGNEGDDWIEKGTSDGAPGDNFDPLGLDRVIGNDIFIGDGENDNFIGEGGDDIMLGKTGFTDRYFGGSGYDWADFKDDKTGVYIDISKFRYFDSPLVPGGVQPLVRFVFDEGLSGSQKADVLTGDEALTYVNNGAQGSVLTQIGLINGLQSLLDTAFGAEILVLGGIAGQVSTTKVFADAAGHITSLDGGNIILGGAGSDMLIGLAGNDVLDGDKYLNVRISVRATVDNVNNATGAAGADGIADRAANGELILGSEIATFDTMTNKTLQDNMLSGKWNPGQLQAVREIIDYVPATPPAHADFDTALFRGNLADYTIVTNTVTGVTTVTDNRAGKNDGIDHVMHIERLMFADQSVVRDAANTAWVEQSTVSILNHAPVGRPTISDATPTSGQVISVNMLGVTDADNTLTIGVIPDPVAYFWQVDLAGNGVFTDITRFAAGEVSRLEGKTITVTPDLLGLSLRVRAVYKDANGVLEQVFSAASTPVAVELAPVFTPPFAFSLDENTTAAGTVLATDGNGDPIAFSLVGGVDAALFTINPLTGALTFNTAPNFELPAHANNIYNVIVQATDGIIPVTQAFAVTVINVNEPATGAIHISGTTATLTALDTIADPDLATVANPTGALNLAGGTAVPIQWQSWNGTVWSNIPGVPGTAATFNATNQTVRAVASYADAFPPAHTPATDPTLLVSPEVFVVGTNGNNALSGAVPTGLFANGHNRTFLGLAGTADTVSYATDTVGVTVNLINNANNTGIAAGDKYIGVENFTGGSGNDTFVATNDGTAHVLNGGAGIDTLDLSAVGAQLVVSINALSSGIVTGSGGFRTDTLLGIENFTGGQGRNTITVVATDTTAHVLKGGALQDTITGGANSADTIVATVDNFQDQYDGGTAAGVVAQPADTANYAAYTTGLTVNLGVINARVLGSGDRPDSSDTLRNFENFIGGSGNDRIIGSAAANKLAGGAGNDTLTGGAGADVFVFNTGTGTDHITDFVRTADSTAHDVIDLTGLAATIADVHQDLTVGAGAHVVLSFTGTTDTIHLDTAVGLLQTSDFAFH